MELRGPPSKDCSGGRQTVKDLELKFGQKNRTENLKIWSHLQEGDSLGLTLILQNFWRQELPLIFL